MSQYNELVTILKELLFNRFYPKPEYIRGLLGDGRGNVLVPGRPDYNYVRFSRSSTETFEVFNKEVSQPVDGWPVLIGSFPWAPGLVQVVATDWAAYAQTGWGDSVASIQAHSPTHEWPNFLPGSDAINVYLRAVTPMRTQAAGSGSTSVIVTAYEYDGATGTNYQWPGLPPFNLQPATPPSGTMRYMGVYLNPMTNTLGVVTGSTTIYTDATEPSRPVWPRGVFPSAYVRLYGGQAAITERDVRDARRLWNDTLIFTGTGAGGAVSSLAAPDGSPNPAWAVDNAGNLSNPGAGYLDAGAVSGLYACDGRLTLTSGTAVTTSDVTAATTLYFTPHNGNRLALYNGSKWLNYTFTEKSLSLSGLTANKNSDVFIYDNAGTPTLERVEWTDDTTRATALALQDGVLVKSGDATRRYIGTFRTTGTTGQTEDSDAKRFCWNYYNRALRRMNLVNGSSHTYGPTTTVRAFNNGGSGVSSVLFVLGVLDQDINTFLVGTGSFASGDAQIRYGVGVNTNTAHSVQNNWSSIAIALSVPIARPTKPQLGLNEYWMTESTSAAGTAPTFGSAALSPMVWG